MGDKKISKTESHEIEFIPPIEVMEHTRLFFSRKKYHKRALRILRNLTTSISCLINRSDCDDDYELRGKFVIKSIKDYLSITPKHRKKLEHMQIFQLYEMPDTLFYLYKSPIRINKEIAEESIRLFLYPNIHSFPILIQHRFACSVLGFCNLLRHYKTTSERLLYYDCRKTYESLLISIGPRNTSRFFMYSDPSTLVRNLYPFIKEVMKQLLVNMKLIRESCFCRVPSGLKSRFDSDIDEFSTLTLHMYTQIIEHMRLNVMSLDSLSMVALDVGKSYYVKELKPFYDDFSDLLNSIDLGLTYMDDGVEFTRCTECEFNHGWSYYLLVLKELDVMSKLYLPAEKNFLSCLYSHRDSINKLIMKSKRGNDHQWLLKHKDLINNESRRHLIIMMLPDQVMNGSDHPQKMKVLIDMSELFADSFEQVGHANPILLRNGIILQFKNEVDIAGPAVFKEWLLRVCQHLFTLQNSLFLSCPHDPHRLYPNPAKVDSQQLEYYRFCGRVIALVLMHDVQIGIGLDRLFFLQLAESVITLEDIRDADPYMYKSCKDILGMETKFIDSDGLGLTFDWETEEEDESGCRKIVELCPGGSTMVVCSMNREEYVNLVVQHCFVKSIGDKVKLFIRGLDDVLTRRRRKNLFQSIELKDLDHMLLFNENDLKEDKIRNEVADGSTPFARILAFGGAISRPKSSFNN